MSSTFSHPFGRSEYPDWRAEGLRYFSYPYYLKNRFGGRVQRISVDAGFTCPNVDGRVAVGGCVYCNNASFSPSRRLSDPDISRQMAVGIDRVQRRYRKCQQFIAYFQPATNTYAPTPQLRQHFEQALDDPRIVGLAIGTRPDCVPDDVLDLLSELARRTYVSVEYGMQTMHNRSLTWINRGHDHEATIDAVTRSRNRGFEIGVHVILGLPDESPDDMLATAREIARLQIHAIKVHNLYAVSNTRLASQISQGKVCLPDQADYVSAVVDLLEVLPPFTIVQRLSGDAPASFLLGPQWCQDKAGVLRAIETELVRRDTWQGRLFNSQ